VIVKISPTLIFSGVTEFISGGNNVKPFSIFEIELSNVTEISLTILFNSIGTMTKSESTEIGKYDACCVSNLTFIFPARSLKFSPVR
jgi:hypothetical protein